MLLFGPIRANPAAVLYYEEPGTAPPDGFVPNKRIMRAYENNGFAVLADLDLCCGRYCAALFSRRA